MVFESKINSRNASKVEFQSLRSLKEFGSPGPKARNYKPSNADARSSALF